jgi:hypothetical protein
MTSVSAVVVGYAFSFNLFPLYSSLQLKTNENCEAIISLSISFISVIYFVLSLVCAFLFGNTLIKADSDIMKNVNAEYSLDPDRWDSFVLRVLFMVVLTCHIPFMFFFGKESLLIMVDELVRRSISSALEK